MKKIEEELKDKSLQDRIKIIERLTGTSFPPDLPKAVQVTGGRSGSTALTRMMEAFFSDAKLVRARGMEILDTLYQGKVNDIKDEAIKDFKNFKDSYVDYKIHGGSAKAYSLHFPYLLYFLKNAPKIIFLQREDYLMRGISIYYADQTVGTDGIIIKEPIDIDKFLRRIEAYIEQNWTITELVNRLVDASRLCRVNFQHLYIKDSFQTIRQILEFLEIEVDWDTTIPVPILKETDYHKISNIDEVLAFFGRDTLEEQLTYFPPMLDEQKIRAKAVADADKIIKEHTEEGIGTPSPKTVVVVRPKLETPSLDPDHHFYIQSIPESASYVSPHIFWNLPDFLENIYLLDVRWQDVSYTPPSYLNEFFEIKDVHSNRSRDYKWVCGFSAFFLKFLEVADMKDHAYRLKPESHNALIQGIKNLIEYQDRCPETLLRFYVSEEVWDRLKKEDLLTGADTEFCKMRYSSEESQLGTMWRLLALFDTEFQWAIETDIPTKGKSDDWVYARIAHWDRQMFYNWIEKNTDKEWALAGEYLIYKENYTNNLRQYIFERGDAGTSTVWNTYMLDFLSGGGIVSRPSRMPRAETVLHRYLDERPYDLKYYHADQNVWTALGGYHSKVPLGWEGWGPDQELWVYLKKVVPVRHVFAQQSIDTLCETQVSVNHPMRRIIAQLRKEGSDFIHWQTCEDIFP